jgi:cyclohexadienyl dehydratase
MRSLVAAGAMLCLSLLSAAAQAGPRLDKIMESKVLRMGTPGDYRPFAIRPCHPR